MGAWCRKKVSPVKCRKCGFSTQRASDDGLVGRAEGVLEAHRPRDQARVDGRASLVVGGKEAGPFPLEPRPVDQGGEPDQLVLAVDHVEQAWPQQVGLFGRARAVLHARRNRRK